MLNFFTGSRFKEKENLILYGVILLFAFLPFQFALNPAPGIDLAVARVFILILFLVWAVTAAKKISFKNDLVSKILLLFLISFPLSLLSTHNLAWSLRKLAFILSIFPVYLILLHVFQKKESLEKILLAFVLGSSMVAFFSLLQFSAQFVFGIDAVYQFIASNLTPLFLGASFSQTVLSYPSWLVASEGATYMRAIGTFPDPHMLSYYLGLSLPWSVALASQKKSRLLWLCALLILLADIATFTRGSYLALIAAAVAIIPLVTKQVLKKLLVVIAVFVLLFAAAPHSPVAGRLTSSFDTQEGSNQARLSNWEQALMIIKQNPLGVGIGMYSLTVDPKADYRTPIYAHNLYLDIAAELGLISGLLFICLLVMVFVSFWKAARKSPLFIAGVASIVLFSVQSLVETPLYSVHVLPVFFLITAIAATIRKNEIIPA